MFKSNISFFTWSTVSACAVVLVFMYLDGYPADPYTAMRFGAIVPELVKNGEYYRLFTYLFVHFGYMHLLMNIGGLLIVGLRVEKYMGHIAFLIIFILSGFAAALCSLFFTNGYAAGASGAVFGLDGAAFVYTRVTKKPMEVLTEQVMLIYIVMGVAMGFTVEGVDNAAHVGGLVMGLLVGWIFAKIGGNNGNHSTFGKV